MYCCCNERRSGSLISTGVRTCADARQPTTTRISASSLLLHINHSRHITDFGSSLSQKIEGIDHSDLLFLRRVESKVQVRVRHLVFAQVVKHWHSSSERHRRHSHADRIASSDFSNKLRQAGPRCKSTQRR